MIPIFFSFLGVGVGYQHPRLQTYNFIKNGFEYRHSHQHPKPEKNGVQMYVFYIIKLYYLLYYLSPLI